MDTLAAGLVTVVVLIVVGAVIAFAVGLPAPVKTPSATLTDRPTTNNRRLPIDAQHLWAIGLLVGALLVYLLAQPVWVIFVVHREPPPAEFQAVDMFARTCEACHGDKGFGIRLTPYLARDELAARLGFDPGNPQDLETLQRYVTAIVSEGHGMMPAWSDENGGPLRAEEIKMLVDFIVEDRAYNEIYQ